VNDKALREHLLWLLDGGNAHISFEAATADLPFHLQGGRAPDIPHSPWQLLEPMRICQWDILGFCGSAEHVSPEFPEGYWPDNDGPPDKAAWAASVDRFKHDRAEIRQLAADSAVDLFTALPWGDGQTILREILLVADHDAYHLGQLIVVRRALGAWPI